ncbi:MAG: phosphoglycerate kinase [bacterium]|nr:phosphoglycerate kinase [bacterium]
MRWLSDLSPELQRVLVRCDLNVPLESGKVLDDFRIRASLPTIQALRERGHKVILLTHLGDPHGKTVESLRVYPVASALRDLGVPVTGVRATVGKEVENAIEKLEPGGVLLLENVRFCPGEEDNDSVFAKKLSRLGDAYVNDAMGVSHRAHASLVLVPSLLPSFGGLLLEQEVRVLSKIKENPSQPFVVIVGGAKVESKGSVIEALAKKANTVLLGNLIGDKLRLERPELLKLPNVISAVDGIMEGERALDIGPRAREDFLKALQGAGTVFWAGPLGMVEDERFREGSRVVANFLASLDNVFSVAGGGDLAAFLGKEGLREKLGYVSTGGGATLHYVAGEELPGLKALS